MEYQYDDRLVLRGGWEPRTSSIPTDKQDVLLPVGDGDLISVGAGYSWSKDSRIDVAAGYVLMEAHVPAGASTNSNSENQANNFLYNPYSGLNFDSQVTAYLFEASYTFQF